MVPHDRLYEPVAPVFDTQTTPAGATDFGFGYVNSSGRDQDLIACDPGDLASDEDAWRRAWDACADRAGITQQYISFLSPARYGQLVATLSVICAVIAAFGIALGLWRVRRRVL